jgi:hypothetical protein
MDKFKKSGLSFLPVFQGKRFVGDLRKQDLLASITSALGELGET